ncbi:hypothetical protein F2P81_015178 [Scophthalmus maximus]|uniref:Uncharacterized protein n=1 Tax=Scophthalmus maximus TaxID=52904 RepID=A0A6A4SL38_SCOMX|nr:hypothetical protein F2P81_015178 [Scophthalmus maximus]
MDTSRGISLMCTQQAIALIGFSANHHLFNYETMETARAKNTLVEWRWRKQVDSRFCFPSHQLLGSTRVIQLTTDKTLQLSDCNMTYGAFHTNSNWRLYTVTYLFEFVRRTCIRLGSLRSDIQPQRRGEQPPAFSSLYSPASDDEESVSITRSAAVALRQFDPLVATGTPSTGGKCVDPAAQWSCNLKRPDTGSGWPFCSDAVRLQRVFSSSQRAPQFPNWKRRRGTGDRVHYKKGPDSAVRKFIVKEGFGVKFKNEGREIELLFPFKCIKRLATVRKRCARYFASYTQLFHIDCTCRSLSQSIEPEPAETNQRAEDFWSRNNAAENNRLPPERATSEKICQRTSLTETYALGVAMEVHTEELLRVNIDECSSS